MVAAQLLPTFETVSETEIVKFAAYIDEWEMKQPFRITGAVWTHSRSLVVQVGQDGHIGRGEAQGVYYLDETAESMLAQVDAVANVIREGITREALQDLLPPGGARNAVDCALW
jgi:L-alanine-DL-glutamate epimerase-like enolase superfamily enzyme